MRTEAHRLAARDPHGALTETYPFLGVLDGSAQLFACGRLVTMVLALNIPPAPPPPGDSMALCAWAHAVSNGTITAEDMRFAVWIRMVPTTHMSRMREF